MFHTLLNAKQYTSLLHSQDGLMRHIVCPYCKESLGDFDEGYCPFCGAVFHLTEAERQEGEILLCLLEARRAMEEEDWHRANQNLIKILRNYPHNRQALALQAQLRQEQKFARLYSLAQYHRKNKRWEKATDYLLQIEELRPEYKDSAELLEVIEKEKWLDKHDPKRLRRANRLVHFILGVLLFIYTLLIIWAVLTLLFSPGGILAH